MGSKCLKQGMKKVSKDLRDPSGRKAYFCIDCQQKKSCSKPKPIRINIKGYEAC